MSTSTQTNPGSIVELNAYGICAALWFDGTCTCELDLSGLPGPMSRLSVRKLLDLANRRRRFHIRRDRQGGGLLCTWSLSDTDSRADDMDLLSDSIQSDLAQLQRWLQNLARPSKYRFACRSTRLHAARSRQTTLVAA